MSSRTGLDVHLAINECKEEIRTVKLTQLLQIARRSEASQAYEKTRTT